MRRLTGLQTPLASPPERKMEVTGLTAPTVTVFISSSLNSFRSEKRYNRSLTIAEFKVWPRGGVRRGWAKEKWMGFPIAGSGQK